MAASRELMSLQTQYSSMSDFRCVADAGWSVSADGKTVTCAAVESGTLYKPSSQSPPPGSRATEWSSVGFGQYVSMPDGSREIGLLYSVRTSHAAATDGASLGWASPDGTVLVGSVRHAGHTAFGVFRGKNFTPLPPPPAGIPLTSIAW